MEVSGLTIETLYHKKILLYQELLDTLNKEINSIIDIDVDALWKISDQKHKIAQEIGELHHRMLNMLKALSVSDDVGAASFDTSSIYELMPDRIKDRLRKAHLTLVALKSEVRAQLEENKKYVGEYLSILDELIGLIIHAGQTQPVYDRNRCPAKSSTPLFLNREV